MSFAKTLSYDHRIRTFWILSSVALVSLVLYVYAINATTHNIAVRQNLEREITRLTAEEGSLEFAYIELRNKITLDTARQYGFAEVSTPIYVSRSFAHSLTYNR